MESKNHTDVLFQKLGQRWYIFAEIDGEIIYSMLPEGMDPHSTKLELYDVIEDHMKRVSNNLKRKNTPEAAI